LDVEALEKEREREGVVRERRARVEEERVEEADGKQGEWGRVREKWREGGRSGSTAPLPLSLSFSLILSPSIRTCGWTCRPMGFKKMSLGAIWSPENDARPSVGRKPNSSGAKLRPARLAPRPVCVSCSTQGAKLKKVLDAANLVAFLVTSPPSLAFTLPVILPTTSSRAAGRASTSAAKTGSARCMRGKSSSPLATLARWPWAASMTRPSAAAAPSSVPSFFSRTCGRWERCDDVWRRG